MKFWIILCTGDRIAAEFADCNTVDKVRTWLNQHDRKYINVGDKLIINTEHILMMERADEEEKRK